MTSAFSTMGLALGALITSALVQYAPAPTHLVWSVLLGAFIAGIVAVLAMAEPGTRRPGVVASLRPRVAVPRQARGAFVAAIPCLIAGWALGGLYLSLGPSLAAQTTGSADVVWGGLVIFLLAGSGATAVLLLRNISARMAMLAGCVFLLASMAVTFAAIAATTSVGFLVGSAVAGVGFGLAFLGAFRMITALAAPDDRAGLLAAIFIVAYLAFSIPALVAGVATTNYGLHPTALVYSGSLAVIAAVAIGMLLLRPGGRPSRPAQTTSEAMPPGPCTGPPCPRAMDPAGSGAATTAARRPWAPPPAGGRCQASARTSMPACAHGGWRANCTRRPGLAWVRQGSDDTPLDLSRSIGDRVELGSSWRDEWMVRLPRYFAMRRSRDDEFAVDRRL